MQLEVTVYISILIASVGVIGGVIYYVLDQRSQNRLRKTDLILRLYQQFFSREFVEANRKVLSLDFKDYDDFERKYGPYPSEEPVSIAIELVINYFEGLGTLLKNNLIEMDLIHELFFVGTRWEKIRPLIYALRSRLNEPAICSNFEYLYNEFQKYRIANQGK